MGHRTELAWGIVGCGSIAAFHAKALNDLAEARLVACTDIAETRSADFAKAWGATSYADLDQFLNADIDAISVCTPNGMRKDIVLRAIDHGLHVITEKPIEIQLVAIDEMIAAAQHAGVHLGCIVQTRFGEAEQKMRELIESGRLGRVVLGEADVRWYRSQEYYDSGSWRGTWEFEGGGALINQAIHTIDLLQWYMGPVRKVSGIASTLARDIEVEDTASAVLQFDSGALGVIKGTTSITPGFPRKLGLYGTDASVELLDEALWLYDAAHPQGHLLVEDQAASRTDSDPLAFPYENHRRQLDDFVSSILGGHSPLVDGHEARKPVEIILAIYMASQTNEVIELPMSTT